MIFEFGRPPTPEEIAKHQMETELFEQEIDGWIDNMSPRESFLLAFCLNAGMGDDKWTARLIGRIQGKMQYKDHVSPVTGYPEGYDVYGINKKDGN
jgi:hypothetical protein